MNSAKILLSFLLSLLGLAVAAFAARFLKMLKEEGDKAMASFQLHQEEAVREFNLLYMGTFGEFAAFFVYGVGGLYESTMLMNIGRVLSVCFIGIAVYIALKWWRRFA
ncbi:MAG: hypothetical protein ABEJ93_00825 [Candidatus Nanohalobium sp.]